MQAPTPVTRREIFAWALFDFANSSYTTVVVTVAFSVYFTTMVAGSRRGDWLWGLSLALSNVLVILLAPVIGAAADAAGRKKLLLCLSYLLCVAGTAALWLVLPGAVALGMTLFVVSNVAFALGESLIAAFLPEISTPRTVGRISGFGWALGYMGGLGCLLLIRPLMAAGFTASNLGNIRWIWPLTAAFFAIAGLPTFLVLRERAPRRPGAGLGAQAAGSVRRLLETFRSLRHFSQLARFLVVFFLYSVGFTTVIAFASPFASRTLGFTAGELVILFLVLQLASAAGAMSFGFVQDRAGSRRSLQISLVLWILVCGGAFLCQTKAQFWGVALLAGLGIGSLQASSRGVISLFSPPAKSGEFFGFWGLALRAAYAIGPALFGAVSSASGSQRAAVLVTGLFFVAGLVGLGGIDEREGRKAALSWAERAP